MNEWARQTFGDPCRECGFSWSIDMSDAVLLVAGLPARLDAVLVDATGDERHPSLGWSVSAYVSHVADNLRIWAERLVGITRGGSSTIASYDENALADVRAYGGIPLAAALWSLGLATQAWLDAVESSPPELVMHHPEMGALSLADVVRINVHDGAHHVWDIERSLAT
jgi:hypothetical protein